MKNSFLNRFEPYMLFIFRVVIGYLIIWHGTAKLFGFPLAMVHGHPSLFSINGIGGILELVGGICLILGLFTRLWAFLLSGELAVAYWGFNATIASWFWPGALPGGAESSVLYCFCFLLLVFTGGGVCALDNKIFRKKDL